MDMEQHEYVQVDVYFVRRIASWACLTIALILIPVSILFIWLKVTFLNTDAFVRTLSPISQSVPIVESLSQNVSDNFFETVNVEDRIRKALPSQSAFLAPILSNTLEQFIVKESVILLTSDRFHSMWEQALRTVHPYVRDVLTGKKSLHIDNRGVVYLDFSGAVNHLKQILKDRGITMFDAVTIKPQVALFQSDVLSEFSYFVRLVSFWSVIAPLLSIFLLFIAFTASPSRMRFFLWFGIGVMASSFLFFLLIQSQAASFAEMPSFLSRIALNDLFSIVTAPLIQMVVFIGFSGFVTASIAFVLMTFTKTRKHLTTDYKL